MRRIGWRVIQGLLGVAIIYFLGRLFLQQWRSAQEHPFHWEFRWEFIAASMVVTWAMYGVLIWGWRTVLAGWREHVRIVDAARIWTISTLSRYIPVIGSPLAISNMALMSQQRGISPAAAMGSSIIMQLLSLTVGGMLALALVGSELLDRSIGPTASMTALGVAGLAIISALLLTSPSFTRLINSVIRRPDAIRPVDPGALAGAVLANLTAWAGYGLALQLLALGISRGNELQWDVATGTFAAGYIAGYLAFLLPGGLGVREIGMGALLLAFGVDPQFAAALVIASRVTLTITELGAAVPFLLLRSKPRVLIS